MEQLIQQVLDYLHTNYPVNIKRKKWSSKKSTRTPQVDYRSIQGDILGSYNNGDIIINKDLVKDRKTLITIVAHEYCHLMQEQDRKKVDAYRWYMNRTKTGYWKNLQELEAFAFGDKVLEEIPSHINGEPTYDDRKDPAAEPGRPEPVHQVPTALVPNPKPIME